MHMAPFNLGVKPSTSEVKMRKKNLLANPGEDDSWIVRDARNTLSKAEEIKANKPLMRKIAAEHKKEGKVLGTFVPKLPKVPGPKMKMSTPKPSKKRS